MNHLQFELTMSNEQIPAFIRLVARKAITDLRTAPVDAGTIRVQPFEFWQIVKHSGAEPIKSGLYTFIRIYDDQHNAVDIQCLNS